MYPLAWYRGTGKENHKSVFENVSHDRCIFCGGDPLWGIGHPKGLLQTGQILEGRLFFFKEINN